MDGQPVQPGQELPLLATLGKDREPPDPGEQAAETRRRVAMLLKVNRAAPKDPGREGMTPDAGDWRPVR